MSGHGPLNWIHKEQHQLKHMSTELVTSQAPSSAPSSSSSSSAPPIYDFASDFVVPEALVEGTIMTKISEKKKRRVLFQLDPDEGCIIYKSKDAGIVPLETIKEIRSGPAARYHREQFAFPEDAEPRWLTLIYVLDGAYKTLHILADTPEVFRMWAASVRKLVAIRQGLMAGLGNVEVREAVWERQYWKGADIERDNRLSFEEVERLCRRLNAALATPQLKSLFDSVDVTGKGYLDFTEFQVFVKALKRRPEIEEVYTDIRKANGGQFDVKAFEKFMRETQHSRLRQDELEAVFAKYSSTPASPSPDTLPAVNITSKEPIAELSLEDTIPIPTTLSLQGFSSFLLSTDNAVFAEKNREIWQDMTRPISEYYISSSHNTYLVGHQLIGVSTVEGYIRALLHSCRSVELDIYDGDTEPVIFHGKTLTSKISVRDVCNAIAKYAFVTSPYPLLISAEVHCGVKQQDVLVDIMLEAFGEALIQAPPEGRPRISHLPSPEDLKGKVLLKAKNLYVVAQLEALRTKKVAVTSPEKPRVLEADLNLSDDESDTGADGGIQDEIKTGLVELKEKWRRVRGKDKNDSSAANHKVKMSFALISLIVYTVGVKCRGLSKELGYAPEHIFSLSENKANNLLKAKVTMRELVQHTRTHMVRVYPKGTRVNSTNYEPHRFWAAGAQLVAINWQTFDSGYTMNQAMFQHNGRAGYILKPDALRGEDEELLSQHTRHVLEVTIISAHQLPRLRDSTGEEIIDKSIVNPLVQVSLHIPDWTHSPFEQSTISLVSLSPPPSNAPVSAPSPSTHAARSHTVSERTRAVKNNGFNPVWRETLQLPFDVVGGASMRELVFVQFSVLEGDRENGRNDPIAVYCTPLASLERGYRHLPLHDAQLSQYLFSTLFVQVQIRDVE